MAGKTVRKSHLFIMKKTTKFKRCITKDYFRLTNYYSIYARVFYKRLNRCLMGRK